ncbi:hypothetical protein [Parathalassolituus penaei]|uniref:Lipoprotein n=1 Tax=Parathalassolituus penaei TaxID=2997323 RepID=A0A9X3ECV5_9GAMM|nr:hypothetical protein [Parathalassolituus penaei]MCY0965249.1 hypothetical protein [Parathalassolituus penaei]
MNRMSVCVPLLLSGLLSLLLTACISVSSDPATDNSVSNDQGDPVTTTTLMLNGLWDGQFDQASTLRLLIWQGNVFGKDETYGYYGTIEYNNSESRAVLSLAARSISSSDEANGWYYASGTAVTYDLDGLLFTVTSSNDTLVGDYSSTTATGSFTLSDDGSWSTSASLSKVAGQWSTGDYELYVTTNGSSGSLKGIAATTGGCAFNGTLSVINGSQNLYAVTLSERKNCDVFNKTDVSGFATLNNNGELEFYLRKDSEQLFLLFSPVSSSGS